VRDPLQLWESYVDPDSTLPVPNPSVIFRELAEGGVIFSTVDEVYFGLNEVGAQVWSLLPPVTTTFGEMTDAIVAKYPEVGPEVIRADVSELLAQLEVHGLLVRAPAGAARADAPALDARGARTL
jgi:hypothetical protein